MFQLRCVNGKKDRYCRFSHEEMRWLFFHGVIDLASVFTAIGVTASTVEAFFPAIMCRKHRDGWFDWGLTVLRVDITV
mgnify:CR=1 FL=1